MELEHSFTVPVPKDQAWDVLLDVERVAPCMPGATLDSVDGDEISGKIKVKLGPITMTYAGTARFTERDQDAGVVTGGLRQRDPRRGHRLGPVRSELDDRRRPDRGDRAHLAERDRQARPVRPGRDGRGQRQADRHLRDEPRRHDRQFRRWQRGSPAPAAASLLLPPRRWPMPQRWPTPRPGPTPRRWPPRRARLSMTLACRPGRWPACTPTASRRSSNWRRRAKATAGA